MPMVYAAESPLFGSASANCLSKRFVDQDNRSTQVHLKSCCLDQDIDVWGCSVASSARRGERQQIRAQLSARGSRIFLLEYLLPCKELTGQVAPAFRFALWPSPSGYLEVDNFDGSALPFGSNDVGPSPAALFLPRCVAPEPRNVCDKTTE